MLASELKYRDLVENANSIILRWSPAGEITFINEFGLKFFGYAEEELLGRRLAETIVPPTNTRNGDLRPLLEAISLRPDDFESMKTSTKGSFGGLGIEVGIRATAITVRPKARPISNAVTEAITARKVRY